MILKKQKGMTLIGLSVGILIALLVTLSLTALYKQSLVSSTNSGQASLRMSKISLAMLSSLNNMQKAGFYIDVNNENDIKDNLKIFSQASLSSNGILTGQELDTPTQENQSVSGNAIVWNWKDSLNSSYSCSGLLIKNKELIALNKNENCETPINLSTTTWSKFVLISNTLEEQSSFVASFRNCAIFSYGEKIKSPNIVLNLVFKNTDKSTNNSTLSGTVCLQNFKR